ncbi:MAG: Ig-like domain-containing protein [Acidobacteriaceae bacterium]
MMKKLCLLSGFALLTLTMVACGGSKSTKTTSTVATISVSPSSPSIAVGATEQFTATAKDSSGKPITAVTFTWASSATGVATVTSGGLATGVAAGTAQITASASGVTSSADTLTVTAPVVATIAVSPSSPSIAVGATEQFSATAKDSSGNTISGVTFTWASSKTAVATIDSSGLATGVAAGTTQITASASNVTSAEDTLTVTQAQSACTPGGSESLLSGGYAFLLKGFDGSGNPALVAGALTFDGAGNITAGSMDMNLNSGVESDVSVTSGCYSVGSDQRGLMIVNTSSGSAPTQNYRFSLGGISGGIASTGHMIDFDATGPFTAGILRKQSGGPYSNASANGSYAFGGSSPQNAALCASPCNVGIAGVIDLDGKGGVSGGSEDFNQNGVVDGNSSNTTWPASPIPIDSGGTYSVTANGRATLTFSLGGGSSTSDTVLYFVSPNETFFIGSDPQTTGAVLAGTALLQSGAPFAANPLSGTYVGYDSGNGITGVGRTDLYLLGPLTSGSNALEGTQWRNTGGTLDSSGLSGGTYSVSPQGRAIMAGGGGHAPLIYLVNTSQFFFLQSNLSVDSGFFELQSGSPFSTSSASGTYALGDIDPEILSAGVISGVATFSPGMSSISVTYDANASGASPTPGTMQSLTYSIDSTGLGLIPAGCSISTTPITCDTMFYIVSPTQAVIMDPQASSPQIQTVDQ